MARILICDDDPALAGMLSEQMRESGHQAECACLLGEGLEMARRDGFDVVLLDVGLPDGNGLECLQQFKSAPSLPEVIIVTGQGEADGAEKAIVSGAWGYIGKPHVLRELPLVLTRALQYRQERSRVREVPVALKRGGIVGGSQAITSCLDQVARAAQTSVSVLITGQTGTGKELFARAIHANSSRAGKNFVVVDCAALPETLIESTLFGHVKGAFTGADRQQDGLVKHADGGTLFLDEVGEMPLTVQKTFLRLLQEHEYRPVGASAMQYSNFRLVAATNRNLQGRVRTGAFRDDLLFRLQACTIELPPLHQRREDIAELAMSFLVRLCSRYGLEKKGVAGDFIEALTAYDWPGNVRELYQTMEQVLTSPALGSTCFAVHLPEQFRVRQARAGFAGPVCPLPEQRTAPPSWRDYQSFCEKEYLFQLKAASGGNVSQACRLAQLSRTRLYQLLNKHGLQFS